MENNSELIIGPLRYTYAVQKINVQERKSATIMETTRTNKNYIDPTGDASNTAQVRLLFTGLDEINRGISDKEDSREFTMDHVSGLRGLIALFKCAPIISIKNDVLSTLWQETVSTDEPITNNDGTEGIQKRIYKSPYIPVAITSLELENVPDMVHAIQATIGLSRVDITPVSTGNTVRYLGKDGFGEEDPLSAYWLKTWIDKIVNKNRVP
ncbi:MAG: hypothetical protein KDH96_08250, partial [Candidatus Riesia sp.]|nr:hypothetical protein [Candidatus Riesia sp.]